MRGKKNEKSVINYWYITCYGRIFILRIQIFGTTGNLWNIMVLQSNIKKLTEEKNKKTEQLAELTKKKYRYESSI